MTNIVQDKRLLSIETSLGDDVLLLQSVEGEEFFSQPFSFTLGMFANIPQPRDKIEQLLGQSVNWTIQDGDGSRVFNGIVHKMDAIQEVANASVCYIMHVQPWFSLLKYNADCKVFQNKTALQIVQDIFQTLSFNDYELTVNVELSKREYCVQYNETAFDFVTRLLAEEGLFYFFTHQKGKHVMVIANDQTAYLRNPEDPLRMSASVSSGRSVQSWQNSYSYGPGAYLQTDYDFTSPTLDLLTRVKTVNHRAGNDKLDYFLYPGSYRKKQEGNLITQYRMQMIETDECVVRAQSSYRGLTAGTRVTLNGDPYVITRIAHHAKDHTHVAGSAGQQFYSNDFTCIPADISYRPPKSLSKPTISGVQTAIVVGPSGEEVYTDKYGRIKVQFFWDRYGTTDEKSSCWVRVAQIWAGNQWGGLFLPRVGDEVVVNFLEGDPDKPLVVGSVYNGAQGSPYLLPDQKTITGIKTRSTKGGEASASNELSFDDKKDNELFYCHAQKDRKTLIENDDSLDVKHDYTVTVTNDYQLSIDEGNYTQTLKKGKRVTTIEQSDVLTVAKGERTISVEQGNDQLTVSQGNQTISINLGKSTTKAMQGIELVVGQNSVKIDQTGVTIVGMMVKINGQTMTQINASGMLQLKGAFTMIN